MISRAFGILSFVVVSFSNSRICIFKRCLTAENSGGNLYGLEIKITPIKETSCTGGGAVVVVF